MVTELHTEKPTLHDDTNHLNPLAQVTPSLLISNLTRRPPSWFEGEDGRISRLGRGDNGSTRDLGICDNRREAAERPTSGRSWSRRCQRRLGWFAAVCVRNSEYRLTNDGTALDA